MHKNNAYIWIACVSISNICETEVGGNSLLFQGFGLNPTKSDNYYGLIPGSAAAAPGIPPRNARYLLH